MYKRQETRELPRERDNARNNARCTQAREATHGLDGQHQDVDRTVRRRVSQRTEINGESTSMVWPTLGSRTAKEQNRTSGFAQSSTEDIRRADIFRGSIDILSRDGHGLGRIFQHM